MYGQPQQGYNPQYMQQQPQQQQMMGGYGQQQPMMMQPGFAPPTPQQDPMRQWFDSVDRDRSGKINPVELQGALSQGGFNFSPGVIEKIMRMFDRDHTNQLDFMEFKQVHAFISQMTGGVRSRDRDTSGTLDGNEVRASLAASGYQLSEPVFQLMMRKYDHEKVGGLRFDDYIELSIVLGTVRNVFAYYDKSRSNAVVFNFDSFIAAVLSIV